MSRERENGAGCPLTPGSSLGREPVGSVWRWGFDLDGSHTVLTCVGPGLQGVWLQRLCGFRVVGGRGWLACPRWWLDPASGWAGQRSAGRPIAQATPQAPLTRSPGSGDFGNGGRLHRGAAHLQGWWGYGWWSSWWWVRLRCGCRPGQPGLPRSADRIRRHDDRLVGPARRGERPLSLWRPSRCWPARRAGTGPTAQWQELAAHASAKDRGHAACTPGASWGSASRPAPGRQAGRAGGPPDARCGGPATGRRVCRRCGP